MKIGLDIMGGDFAPAHEVLGAIDCLRESNNRFHVVLVGDEEKINLMFEVIFSDDFDREFLHIIKFMFRHRPQDQSWMHEPYIWEQENLN